ncbi:hypothetical protein AGLY_009604 [Aphis glycines]|uniref:Transposable element P transposase-like GTP-binding insertion domain-containing protein n=1 Tax=Aphis glycines TaxID=307491 RepID=A0A6G0TGP8_APHGL|nr:hypothetical protein AGLY_009604 [Aphis glycines]
MARYLGADLHNQISSFLHFVTKENVCIFLDSTHILKLVRNTIGNWGLQEDNRLHLATKIRSRHIFYSKEKIKVSLAAQNTRKLKILEIAMQQLHFKLLFFEHEADMNNFINSSIKYLKSLQSKNHLNILTSPRKTGLVKLFEATYKRLLVHTELSIFTKYANLDSTNILFVSSGKKIIKENVLDILCVEKEQSFANENEKQDDATKKHALIDIKNRGGLIKTSTDVITLYEQVFITIINQVHKHLENLIDFLIIKTMSQINIKN